MGSSHVSGSLPVAVRALLFFPGAPVLGPGAERRGWSQQLLAATMLGIWNTEEDPVFPESLDRAGRGPAWSCLQDRQRSQAFRSGRTRAMWGWQVTVKKGTRPQTIGREGGRTGPRRHHRVSLVEDARQKPGTSTGPAEGTRRRVLKVLNLRSYDIATAMRSLGNGNFSAALWSYETTS